MLNFGHNLKNKFENYSYPLLKAYKNTGNSYNEYHSHLIDTIEIYIKYITFSLFSVYKTEKFQDPKIDKQITYLTKPSLGHNTQLIETFLKRIKYSNIAFVQQMIEFMGSKIDENTLINLEKISKITHLEELVPKKTKERTYLRLLGSLVYYRNKNKGHGATKDDDDLMEIVFLLSNIIYDLYCKIDFLAELELKIVDKDYYDKNADYSFKENNVYIVAVDNSGESVFLTVSPLLISYGDGKDKDIYVLNDAKTNQIEYLSYNTGKNINLTPNEGEIYDVCKQQIIQKIFNGKEKLPKGYYDFKIEREAENFYSTGEFYLTDLNYETALEHFLIALEYSPSYDKAVDAALNIYLENDEHENAIALLSNYIDYMSVYPEKIKQKLFISYIEILVKLKNFEKARQFVKTFGEKVLKRSKKEYEEFIQKQENTINSETESGNEVSYDNETIILPHEVISYFITKQKKGILLIYSMIIFLTTGVTASLFLYNGNQLMCFTIIALGFLWLITIISSLYLRRIISNSRNNFVSFLIKLGNDERKFRSLVQPLFGDFKIYDKKINCIYNNIKSNRIRILFIILLSILLIITLSHYTIYSPVSGIIDLLYYFLLFCVISEIIYFASIVFNYYKLLKTIRNKRINFTLVQHPKLSIKYLSILSEKIFIPISIIYLSIIFILYLGPFEANIAFVAIIIMILFFVIYSYYNSLYLITKIVSHNKWATISKLSKHFDLPFNNMLEKGKLKYLDELKEIEAIRDYIFSYKSLPITKKKLFTISILLAFIPIGTVISFSNLLPNKLVPAITSSYDKFNKGWIEKEINIGNSKHFTVDVTHVDDAFIVFYKNLKNNLNNSHKNNNFINKPGVMKEDDSVARCDWKAGGQHGELKINIEFPTDYREQELILIAYNKVYHGKFLFGGGKLSYNIKIYTENENIYENSTFIRDNKKGIKSLCYLKLIKKPNNKIKLFYTYDKTLMPESVINKIKTVEQILNKEDDSQMLEL